MVAKVDIGDPLWIEMVVADGETARLDYRVIPNKRGFEAGLLRGTALSSGIDPEEPISRLTALVRGDRGLDRYFAALTESDLCEVRTDGLGYCLRAEGTHLSAEAAAVEQSAPLEVLQRANSQAVEEFLARAGRLELAPSTGRLDPAMLGAALPEGVVFLSRAGESASRRRKRVLGLLAARSTCYVAASRAIGDAHWRLTAFPQTEPDRQLQIGTPWVLDGFADTPEGCQLSLALRVVDGRRIYSELIKTAAQGNTPSTVALTEKLQLPREPMTIVFEGESLFLRRLTVRFFHDALAEDPPERGAVNFQATLELVPDPLAKRTLPPLEEALLLGRLVEPIEAGAGQRLMRVEPASRDAVVEPALQALVDWATPDAAKLSAVTCATAFERPDEAGLQVRWKAGDLVLISVADGRVPAILGAPRLARPALSDALAADMALLGGRIELAARAPEAKPDTVLTLEQGGRATLRATEVNIADRVTITQNEVKVTTDTKIAGNLDVE
ncbi:hypothetical protein Q5Y75_24620 [Ruegeria sp. 2205SS24-7]|uniref:hypothetical protein n=1 Tax=Ruegeria discodermiae TaxID=3064389 RepID=UPI0027406924|nr:hypothetical protein [Ruegeria sp. 2205SS24-7]MDP5220376.1 hypothetical protein [Ruegeria sp. 2205SS24-7]